MIKFKAHTNNCFLDYLLSVGVFRVVYQDRSS